MQYLQATSVGKRSTGSHISRSWVKCKHVHAEWTFVLLPHLVAICKYAALVCAMLMKLCLRLSPSLVYSLTHAFTNPPPPPLAPIHSLAHSLTHSLTYSLTHSPTPSFIYPLKPASKQASTLECMQANTPTSHQITVYPVGINQNTEKGMIPEFIDGLVQERRKSICQHSPWQITSNRLLTLQYIWNLFGQNIPYKERMVR